MHEVLVNRLGGLSLPRKSVVRLTDLPDMTLDVYRGRETTKQQQQQHIHHSGPSLTLAYIVHEKVTFRRLDAFYRRVSKNDHVFIKR